MYKRIGAPFANDKNERYLCLVMPEREYFSLRYAVPGYSFLLVVISVNIWPLILVLRGIQTDIFGAFLGFLSLFAGSAIGFLVSQFFYFRFDRNKTPFRIRELADLTDVLVKSTKVDKNLEKLKSSKDDIEAVTDFLFNISAEKNQQFVRYSERRWDMYLLMSSLLWSLGVGTFSAVAVRAYFEIVFFKNPLAMERLNFVEFAKWVQSINRIEPLTWIFAAIAILVLARVLLGQRHRIMMAYHPMLEGFLRYAAQDTHYKAGLAQAFPEYFTMEERKERQADKARVEREKA